MPRNGSNVYSPPPNTLATTLTTIKSPEYNAFVNDLAADLNLARPIVAGGTGATSVASAQTALSLDNKVVYASKSSNYTALATDNNACHRYTANATVSLTAAATLGANWHYTIIADFGDVTIDPNGSETINGQSTLVVPSFTSAQIVCDGSNFFLIVKPASWESISTYTLSAVSSLSITNLGSFRFLRATGVLIPSTGASIAYRTSTNNGSSYDSGASDYTIQGLVGSSATASASTASSTSASITSLATSGCAFETIFGNFNSGGFLLTSSKNYTLISAGGQASEVVGSSRNQSTGRNAIQFFPSAGTLTGRIHLEGIRG